MPSILQRLLAVASLLMCLCTGPALAAEQVQEWSGVVSAMPSSGLVGDWTVGDRHVRSTASTTFNQEHGNLAIGVTASVRAIVGDGGALVATRIEFLSAPAGSTPGGNAGDDSPGNPGPGNGGHDNGGHDNGGNSSGNGADDSANHPDPGELRGTVESLPAAGLVGVWHVSGHSVTVVQATRINQEAGAVVVGATVEIHGTADGTGALIASGIEVVASSAGAPGVPEAGARIEILGTISALPTPGPIGTWTVADRTIVVSASTVLEAEHGTFAVGSTVEVNAIKQADGSLAAVRIEAKPGQGAPVPSAHFWGHVTALPSTGLIGVWRVDDRLVDVSESTRIDTEHGAVALQVVVEVEGWLQADGVVAAKSIETQAAAGDLPDQSAQVVEFHNPRLGRFFITASTTEIKALDQAGEWQRTGEAFRSGGNEAACRFYGMPPRGPDSHFFTIDANECAKVMGDMPAWTFEGFAFSITPPGPDGACPAGLVAVHRLYNQAQRAEDMNHRYVTTPAAIAATVASGWIDEGVVMCAQP